MNVDWSNLCCFGSNVGTIDAVAFSAMAAPADTVAIARVMATTVDPMGTLSDDADEDASAAASFAAAPPALDALDAPPASAGATLDLHRKRRDTGAPLFERHLLAMVPL